MEPERKIELVVRKVSFEQGEEEDIAYWANLPVKERMRQAFEWNRKVWKHILKNHYPEKIEWLAESKSKA